MIENIDKRDTKQIRDALLISLFSLLICDIRDSNNLYHIVFPSFMQKRVK